MLHLGIIKRQIDYWRPQRARGNPTESLCYKEHQRMIKLIGYLPQKAQYWVGYAVGTMQQLFK